MERNNRVWITLIALALTVAVAACSRSPAVKYYTLSPTQIPVGAANSDLAIVIGPAQFPRTLARNQIVTRTGTEQVKVDEFNVWSAPLATDFLRVLGDNLAAELGSNRVTVYPAATPANIDYRVAFQVSQFDGVPGDSVSLRVRWNIVHADGTEAAAGYFSNSQIIPGNDQSYDALVAAHSKAINDFARELASKLQQLGKPTKN